MTTLKNWWAERDAREQLLLQIMLVAVTLFLAYMLVVRPILSKRDDLTRELDAAQIEADLVAAAIRETGSVSKTQSDIERVSNSDFRLVISRSAQQMGVSLTRLQPDQSGGLNIWADETTSTLLYTWLASLQDKHGIYVARASLQNSSGNGSIRAQILLKNGDN